MKTENNFKKNLVEACRFKCRSCGCTINEGEFYTFECCDDCFDKAYKKRTEASGSVAAPKPDTERIFSGTPEEILDELESTDDAYYHHSQLEPVIAMLQSELSSLRDQLRQRDELIKELLPIAEFAYTHFKAHKLNWATALETISRAKTILGI